MENLELRIQKLEKKYRALKYSVLFLMGFTAYAGLNGNIAINSSAHAQQAAEKISKDEAGVPSVVEAEVFLLKDSGGNIRGIWSADDDTTSFAMMHKEKNPIIAMAVDRKNASMSLTDVYEGKISVGLNDSVRSIAIVDDTKRNNIYFGLTGEGAASVDIVSTGNSAVVIDGATSTFDMSGDSAVLALTETVGSAVALKAQPSSSMLTFLDFQNKEMSTLSTIDGKTQLYMNSPTLKEEKTITTAPEDQLSFSSAAQKKLKDDDAEEEESPSEKKETNKIVNMNT